MEDILGQALYDHFQHEKKHPLWIYNKYGPKEQMPVDVYFRDEPDMPDLEWLALERCTGHVLDIGAGTGSHALALQQRELTVTALDISPLAVWVMQQRGIKQVVEADIYKYDAGRFDTLLMLMNGIGLAATLDGLRTLLEHLKGLVNPGGQLLLDSSDVAYLYDGKLPTDGYYGEITYRYAYKRQQSDWFKWLYADEHTLTRIAAEAGWDTEILLEDEFGQYLARLTGTQ